MPRTGKCGVFLLMLTLAFGLVFANAAFAADIVLDDLQSQPANLSNLAGKPTVLFFWTTSCPYCRTELRDLNKAHPQMEKEGVAVFAVNVGEPVYRVTNFLKNYALSIRVLLDKEAQAAENYGIRGVPTYIFINKNNQVVSTEHRLPDNYLDILSR